MTQASYKLFVQLNLSNLSLPATFASLVRNAWKHYSPLLSVSQLIRTTNNESVPWISLKSLATFWISNRQTRALIFRANETYTYPFLHSKETLAAEVSRRKAWLDSKNETPDVQPLRDSYDSVSYLDDLLCTWDQWSPAWAKHQKGLCKLIFLHFRLFPDGLGIWTRREEGYYALLLTLLQFPAATRVAGACSTVGELTLLSRSALREISWRTITLRLQKECNELVNGVELDRDTATGLGHSVSFLCLRGFFFFFFFLWFRELLSCVVLRWSGIPLIAVGLLSNIGGDGPGRHGLLHMQPYGGFGFLQCDTCLDAFPDLAKILLNDESPTYRTFENTIQHSRFLLKKASPEARDIVTQATGQVKHCPLYEVPGCLVFSKISPDVMHQEAEGEVVKVVEIICEQMQGHADTVNLLFSQWSNRLSLYCSRHRLPSVPAFHQGLRFFKFTLNARGRITAFLAAPALLHDVWPKKHLRELQLLILHARYMTYLFSHRIQLCDVSEVEELHRIAKHFLLSHYGLDRSVTWCEVLLR